MRAAGFAGMYFRGLLRVQGIPNVNVVAASATARTDRVIFSLLCKAQVASRYQPAIVARCQRLLKFDTFEPTLRFTR